ncbi:FAD-dependent oxidoreductase [Bradyrhizobium sp. CSA112]|uniref:NAD(P)/FAD-dependent oxidoreductase n=1 Tax=Bradyrhizobium sp. CSA112 TaxID=2699170 RepID=UPI0023B07827|nr:FAD-dependent oxidoreductase [Bradyrhizobium sp. CSA112]MDE5458799.1 FAD-dependent oxidoreductase [Bradyrhizobium sp. CSA112]
MSNEPAIVIVGAGEAGTAAAIALREGGWQGPVVLIGNETMLPYERPPLSKAILTEEMDPGPKLLITHQRLAELEIGYLEGRSVESIDRVAHTVTLSDGAQLAYERLLLTTGAHPRKLSIPAATGSRMATLRTYADALAIRRNIGRGCELVVIGGGFIGLEVAASAVSRGASVTVVEAGPRLLTRAVPAPMAELIKTKHERAGARIETGAMVEHIDANEGRSKVVLADGRTHLADLVLIAVGAVPNVELAQAAGLTVDNGIALDEMLATSDPHIFAAGDCCSFPHRLYGERIRLEAWRNAQRQGAAAAANILGANRPYEDVPWFWSDQYDETLQIAGLCREQDVPVARNLGAKGQLFFYLAADRRLVAACAFGSLGAVAKEIRFAEMMIGRRLAPKAEALADPAVSMKSLLV